MTITQGKKGQQNGVLRAVYKTGKWYGPVEKKYGTLKFL